MLYKESSYIGDEPLGGGGAGCCAIGKGCDKDQIERMLNSYSAWKKCNNEYPIMGTRNLYPF